MLLLILLSQIFERYRVESWVDDRVDVRDVRLWNEMEFDKGFVKFIDTTAVSVCVEDLDDGEEFEFIVEFNSDGTFIECSGAERRLCPSCCEL